MASSPVKGAAPGAKSPSVSHEQRIRVVEDQRCELWQGVWTADYEKRWLPKIIK